MIKRISLYILFIAFLGAVNFTAPSFAVVHKASETKIKQEIKTILAQPEYNKTYKVNYIEKQIEYINIYLGKIIRKLYELLSFGDNNIQGNISKILALAVIVLLLVMVALTIKKMNKTKQNKRKRDSFSLSDTLLASSDFLLEEAARLAHAGDYKNAFRLVYLAIVSYLADKKSLRFEKSRTNWDM